MKIYVDKIPEGGLELSEKIEPGSLLLEDQAVISFINPIDVKADVTKASGEIFADISVESPVEYTCVKCLSRFNGIFRKKFNVILEVRPAEVVELDDEIRQEIILDYPMKVICKPDCKGLCANCGQNLNIANCECNNTK